MPERAEIEAVATIIERWKVSGAPTSLRNGMLIPDCTVEIVAYLDRVRDARGDDEVFMVKRQHLRPDQPGEPWNDWMRVRAARSPQDEDHEAGIRAMLAEAEGRGLRMRTDDGAEVAAMDEADVRALAAAYLSRSAPSRDGTVAVEDWRTIATQLASLLRELHPQNPYYREKQAEALAAFDALAGESNEGVHDAYVEPLGSGYRGFQARCWSCEWRGPEHLRGDEEMGTPESRAHKNAARADAAAHSAGEDHEGGNQNDERRH